MGGGEKKFSAAREKQNPEKKILSADIFLED